MDKILSHILSLGFEYSEKFSSLNIVAYVLETKNITLLIEFYEPIMSIDIIVYKNGNVKEEKYWDDIIPDDVGNIIDYINNLNGIKQIIRKNKIQKIIN